mmetsp:Transcript_2023/g.7265  ORF Transcript_2023/g.7265 Transcript_2023/m.7265 type:complete len:96 (+) Transcript_2023:1589-1876(+)
MRMLIISKSPLKKTLSLPIATTSFAPFLPQNYISDMQNPLIRIRRSLHATESETSDVSGGGISRKFACLRDCCLDLWSNKQKCNTSHHSSQINLL